MSFSKASKAVLKPTRFRSMFIRVKPTPRQLSERRAVLRTLQKYGNIEVFQPLIEPGSFLSVATETSTADHLISNSPLRFDLVSPPASAPRDVYALPESSSNTSDSFILHIFPSTSQHRLQITKSPLYGPWPEEDPAYGSTKSFATSTLEKLVPVDIAAQGMADWERGGQLLKASDRPRPQMKEELLAEITEERKARRAEKEKDQKMIAAGGLLAKFQACSENDGR
ncbi:hypothetical protein DL546_009873 [Coniochaeta pulveracea]|uniref:Uncharacterized protein n=1 Tax=Coniochaeta pulveracea TaxID=177199 RepID=A0A420YPD6_9PEZI|nr:hypothetical protein DL546_009873 [Coniochaeta pulveracea]